MPISGLLTLQPLWISTYGPNVPRVLATDMPNSQYFHMHLISDATGETLTTVARAATAYYAGYQPIEHVYALVRTTKQLERAMVEIERQPGIVLYTIADKHLQQELERHCMNLSIPTISILDPVINSLAAYLETESRPHPGGQHTLNAEYFRRMDALNYTLVHDDGQNIADLNAADVILIGVSRSSKTPTSIYLANKGVKTANIPLVPGVPHPPELETVTHPLVVGLAASPERISQIRRHRLLTLHEARETAYVDRRAISDELIAAKKLCARYKWPVIDVTRRSIEETAAAVLNLLTERRSEVVP